MRSQLAFVVAVLRALWSERNYKPSVSPLAYDAQKRAEWQAMIEQGRRVA